MKQLLTYGAILAESLSLASSDMISCLAAAALAFWCNLVGDKPEGSRVISCPDTEAHSPIWQNCFARQNTMSSHVAPLRALLTTPSTVTLLAKISCNVDQHPVDWGPMPDQHTYTQHQLTLFSRRVLPYRLPQSLSACLPSSPGAIWECPDWPCPA